MKKKAVTAIVFADRCGEELLPLTETCCVALLPVATKPLIEHTLDALSMARIHKVILIITAKDAPQVKAALGTGERLGVELEYVFSQGQEPPATLLSNLGEQLHEPEYLLLRGDFLHGLKINDFLQEAEQMTIMTHLVAMVEDQFTSICLWRKTVALNLWQDSNILHWDSLQQPLFQSTALAKVFSPVSMKGRLSLLDSLASYYRANFEVLANEFPALTLPGYRMTEHLLVGHRSYKVPPLTSGIVGHRCHIHSQAQLSQVILGEGVIVDRAVELSHTIVFPYTYIGKSLKLQNAIIWGNCWIALGEDLLTLHIAHDLSLVDLKKQSLKARILSGIKRLFSWVPLKK